MRQKTHIEFTLIAGPEGSRSANFEMMVALLLKRTIPQAVHVNGAGGDGGIDILVDTPEGREVFQVKYFCSGLNWHQCRQIQQSLARCARTPRLRRWTLVVPQDPTPHLHDWFRSDLQNVSPALPLTWFGKTELLDMLLHPANQDIRREYFDADSPWDATLPTLPVKASSPQPAAGSAAITAIDLARTRVDRSANAVLLDNSTLRFAARALNLSNDGSRFDTIHIACLQQLIEAIILHDVILVPHLDRSGWDGAFDGLLDSGLVRFGVTDDWNTVLESDASHWLDHWMASNTGRGLIARLLHMQKAEWERKGIRIDRASPLNRFGAVDDKLTALWLRFAQESRSAHLHGPTRSYSASEWGEWLDSVQSHGRSLLYWMLYRPFYYHLLANMVLGIPYYAHPTRGMALTFDALERSHAEIALAMVASLHVEWTTWCNKRLGGPVFRAAIPPVFRAVLHRASTPSEIVAAARELRASEEACEFRAVSGRLAQEGARDPNAAYQACIALTRLAEEMRMRWRLAPSETSHFFGVRLDEIPRDTFLSSIVPPHNRKSFAFIRSLADSITHASSLSLLYDKHFWDRQFDAERFDGEQLLSISPARDQVGVRYYMKVEQYAAISYGWANTGMSYP